MENDAPWLLWQHLGFCQRFRLTLSALFPLFVYYKLLTPSTFLIFSKRPPHIIEEQEDFIRRVTEIPLDQRKCRDLITLDTLHLYCGGPELTPIARQLNAYSRRRKYPLISRHLCTRFPLGCQLCILVFCSCRNGNSQIEGEGSCYS